MWRPLCVAFVGMAALACGGARAGEPGQAPAAPAPGGREPLFEGLGARSRKVGTPPQADVLFQNTAFDQLLFGQSVSSQPPSTPTAPIDTDMRLLGVRAIATNNVIAVGRAESSNTIGQTLAEQWNGTTWTVMTTANGAESFNELSALTVISATNVWAVGDRTSTDRTTPTPVLSGITFAHVATSQHTCAVRSTSGDLYCWGRNTDHEGGPTTMDPQDPMLIGSGYQDVAAGRRHTCATVLTGGVKCWGSNRFGELGDGTNTNSSTPVNVTGLSSGVSAISAGYGYSCALMSVGGYTALVNAVANSLASTFPSDMHGQVVDEDGIEHLVIRR